MVAQRRLSSADLLEILKQKVTSTQQYIPDSVREGFLKAAAVLTAIRDVGVLKPLMKSEELKTYDVSAADVLQKHLVPVSSRSFDGKFMLSRDARREALSQFANRGEIQAALEANQSERRSDLQIQFESYLLDKAKPLEQQTVQELERTLQIALWADRLISGVPETEKVERLLELKRLLGPFEMLAGDKFRGRQSELDTLRSFVGVLPPESILRRLGSAIYNWVLPAARSALCINGPGGVGKSALVARFMLEHTRVRDDVKVPFAYIDFDRPAMDISDPLALLVEALRQLALQFPGKAFEKFYVLADELAQSDAQTVTNRLSSARQLFSEVLKVMQSDLGPRPYLIVLDTFEEVQYRGEARASELWALLVGLQQQWPFLRVVISGRAPVRSLYLAGAQPESLELAGLDSDSAVGMLLSEGFEDEKLASRIVDQVGGVPLSLKLVGEMFRRNMLQEGGIKDLKTKSRFWITTSAEYIQGQLYDRILGHIHDEQIQRLAHPGLVLRRITPEVILRVLNEPCRLGITTREESESLFQGLERETSLVSRDDEEGALVHRADLRRLMLGLLRQREPGRVADIHRKAIEYYSNRSDLRSRAELIYHKASTSQDISRREVADPEVRSSLQASIAELPPETQNLLASYGLHVSKDILESASRDQQDFGIRESLEDMFPYGPSASREIDSWSVSIAERLGRPTPLYQTAARICRHRGENQKALEILEDGLVQTITAGRTLLTTELLSEKAWALREDWTSVEPVLSALRDYAVREGNPHYVLQEMLQRHDFVASNQDAPSVVREIAQQVERLDGMALWNLVPAFGGGILMRLADQRVRALAFVANLVISDESPFTSTRLPSWVDRGAKRESTASARAQLADANIALSEMIDAAYGILKSRSTRKAKRFAGTFGALCKVWPYTILQVRPPYYGHNRSRLSRPSA